MAKQTKSSGLFKRFIHKSNKGIDNMAATMAHAGKQNLDSGISFLGESKLGKNVSEIDDSKIAVANRPYWAK